MIKSNLKHYEIDYEELAERLGIKGERIERVTSYDPGTDIERGCLTIITIPGKKRKGKWLNKLLRIE